MVYGCHSAPFIHTPKNMWKWLNNVCLRTVSCFLKFLLQNLTFLLLVYFFINLFQSLLIVLSAFSVVFYLVLLVNYEIFFHQWIMRCCDVVSLSDRCFRIWILSCEYSLHPSTIFTSLYLSFRYSPNPNHLFIFP